jgi:protein arginine kinase activator
MRCDECGEREAVVHLTKVVDDDVAQVHLCEQCAAASGIETASAAPAHPLAGILQAAQARQAHARDAARCAYCGTSQQDFRSSGRLGCAHCYGAFTESLRELVQRVHGEARHTGRRYEPPNPASPPLRSAASLRDELAEAIAREEFERAAALRDALRGLE